MIGEDGKSVFREFSFSNTTEFGEAILAKLSSFAPEELEIGLEATGCYWLAVYSYLHDRGYRLHVINPIQTDGWRKGVETRRRKTNVIDSVLISELVRDGDFIKARLPDEAVMSMKNLTRFRRYLVDSIGDLKRKVISVLDQDFPEYQGIFSNVSGKHQRRYCFNPPAPPNLNMFRLKLWPSCLLSFRAKGLDLSQLRGCLQPHRNRLALPLPCVLAYVYTKKIHAATLFLMNLGERLPLCR